MQASNSKSTNISTKQKRLKPVHGNQNHILNRQLLCQTCRTPNQITGAPCNGSLGRGQGCLFQISHAPTESHGCYCTAVFVLKFWQAGAKQYVHRVNNVPWHKVGRDISWQWHFHILILFVQHVKFGVLFVEAVCKI